MRKGEIAPWFDEPGGGTQYKIDPDFVAEIEKNMKPGQEFIDALVDMEYLERL